MFRIPQNRPPIHPGEMLAEEFLMPLRISQVQLARRIGVPFQRVNQIVNRRRSVTADTALRLGQFFGTTPGFWLSLQQRWDLYHAAHSARARTLGRIKPLAHVA